MTTPDALHREAHLTRLDGAIRELDASADENSALLIENLKAARESLFGAMPVEYEVNLETAAASSARIADAALRGRVQKTIAALLDEIPKL